MGAYVLLVLAVVVFGFAAIKVLYVARCMITGDGVSLLGMFAQPFYIGVGIALGVWMLNLGGWLR